MQPQKKLYIKDAFALIIFSVLCLGLLAEKGKKVSLSVKLKDTLAFMSDIIHRFLQLVKRLLQFFLHGLTNLCLRFIMRAMSKDVHLRKLCAFHK